VQLHLPPELISIFTDITHLLFCTDFPQSNDQLKGLWVNFGTTTSITSCKVDALVNGPDREAVTVLPGFERLAIICGDVGTHLVFALPKVAGKISVSSMVFVRVCFWQGWEDAAVFMPGEASWWLQVGQGF
jgi:hypothetical protein